MGNREIKENAIFIADSHYPHHGDAFLTLLQKIAAKEIQTPQIFLMGDNFDLLFGYNDYIQTFSAEAIELLQSLSKEIEFIYLEGNHDFCLKALFPDIRVYSREEQPVYYTLNGQKVALSHGDKYVTGFGYDLYCKLLRNKTTLTLLKPFQKRIINDRMSKLAHKKICHPFVDFEARVGQILEHYQEVDLVIEGHFHQAKTIGKYISLPSLACQGKVGVVENGELHFKRL
ncbi:UDP-2,3-diacylglucosamine diphosphatase [Sulfurovum mangrovi]|uniref:UDP-2,3-diacylglucosamine diphosphatase n=1 Tax=Sulfurovum mangrovi TaxID=2893889 RepID=UPI001E4F54B2|nr:metallophosphoesterase [Sulfurovum mangrovi]UFH58203.1 metallophosphoesterase [Sulfurovum mangrovi]